MSCAVRDAGGRKTGSRMLDILSGNCKKENTHLAIGEETE